MKNDFLANFSEQSTRWEILVPGRAAVLRLAGPNGSLDLFSLYFATGMSGMVQPRGAAPSPDQVEAIDASARRQRRLMRNDLASSIRPPDKALSVLMGDFNWVTDHEDRVHKLDGAYTGIRDVTEEEHFREVVLNPFQLHELRQTAHTHDSAIARSRLDRVYWNQHLSQQLDREVLAVPLEWVPHISDHRAVAFARRAPNRKAWDPNRPIPAHVLKHPFWPIRVAAEYNHLVQDNAANSNSPLRRHMQLKQAMRIVADRIQQEHGIRNAERDETTDDKLGHTMRFIRAAESGWQGQMQRSLKHYPYLSSLSPHPMQLAQLPDARLAPYRRHALQLARESAITQLEELHRDMTELPEEEKQQRRSRIHKLLQRLSPGRTSSVPAVMGEDGQILTDPKEMAEALRKHWKDVFSPRRVDEARLQAWLQEDMHRDNLPEKHDPIWNITRHDIQTAVRRSPDSATGPDGIPFLAWRRLGPLAIDVLHDTLSALTAGEEDTELASFMCADNPAMSFNESLMVFLGKTSTVVDPMVGEVFEPGETRPLNIVNSDNRILANAVRFRVEPIFNTWVSPIQQGFLPGRSMISNVVEIDQAMMKAALQQNRALAIFFDFKAAFPSVAHRFLTEALRALDLPDWLTRFVEVLYRDNRCQLIAGGVKHPGFDIHSGIRQGCPLSPLLFAIAAEVLLRRMGRLLPELVLRAYADDLAAVIPRGLETVPTLAALFHDFARVSCLELNLPKTVVVPLYPAEFHEVASNIRHAARIWAGIKVAGAAKYLGFYLGPNREHLTTLKPIQKYLDRATNWGKLPSGLFLATAAYSVYILPVLAFVLQLDELPPDWKQLEAKALRRMAPGPGNWCTPEDLHNLKRWGMPKDFPDPEGIALAAKLRVATYENAANGGLRVAHKARELQEWLVQSPHLDRIHLWASWFARAFVVQLHNTVLHYCEMGHAPQAIQNRIAQDKPRRDWDDALRNKVRKTFQRAARACLPSTSEQRLYDRLRYKLNRWRLPTFPNITTTRAQKVLSLLPSCLPPRAMAAFWKTWWNAWVTQRRKQTAPLGRCVFGCDVEASDSIEHYANCIHVSNFAWDRFRLPRAQSPPQRMAQFMALDLPMARINKPALFVRALRTAAVYRTHCMCTHDAIPTGYAAREALPQAAMELVKGHATATNWLARAAILQQGL